MRMIVALMALAAAVMIAVVMAAVGVMVFGPFGVLAVLAVSLPLYALWNVFSGLLEEEAREHELSQRD